jgi:hypothetical protein
MGWRYDRDQLAEAVRTSQTLSEAIAQLGRKPTAGSRRYVRSLLLNWKIDASHLRPEGVRHTEQQLREAVRASRSTAEVVRRLGINPVGGNQAHIGRRIRTFGIDTSHFVVPRPRGRRPLRDVLVLGRPQEGRVPGERLRRALIRLGCPENCVGCGIGAVWNGEPLRLEVDHINGEWWDNRAENLRLLCPNCHAVTDTYRGRKRADSTGVPA